MQKSKVEIVNWHSFSQIIRWIIIIKIDWIIIESNKVIPKDHYISHKNKSHYIVLEEKNLENQDLDQEIRILEGKIRIKDLGQDQVLNHLDLLIPDHHTLHTLVDLQGKEINRKKSNQLIKDLLNNLQIYHHKI